jgi:hypothetical protein
MRRPIPKAACRNTFKGIGNNTGRPDQGFGFKRFAIGKSYHTITKIVYMGI